jgi:hypothetical protein
MPEIIDTKVEGLVFGLLGTSTAYGTHHHKRFHEGLFSISRGHAFRRLHFEG